MFYACLSIMIMLVIMIACVVLSVIDLEAYNFGLYIILLCIVGSMLACALCIANPTACQNPAWYTNMCIVIQEMHPNQTTVIMEPSKSTPAAPEMTFIRSMMTGNAARTIGPGGLPLRQESRPTVAMLAPAVHIMHQVWRGMAWVAEEIEDDEEDATKSHDFVEKDHFEKSLLEFELDHHKKLSTVAESSTDSQLFRETDQEISSSCYNSNQDIIV